LGKKDLMVENSQKGTGLWHSTAELLIIKRFPVFLDFPIENRPPLGYRNKHPNKGAYNITKLSKKNIQNSLQ
jgi:hypothetical protein